MDKLSFSFKEQGFDELERKLERLLRLGASNKSVEELYRQAARPMARRMKTSSGPRRTGRLASSIGIRKAKKNRSEGAKFVVGPRGGKKGAPHAHLVNLGTKAGMRKAKDNAFSIPRGGGEIIRSQTINHGGFRGRFFVQNSFKQTKDKVVNGFFTRLDSLIQSKFGI